jgi:hypothetical protein
MKVQPAAAHEETNAPPTVFAALYHAIASFWRRSQICHGSEYSVERLLAFRDYYQHTSVARVVAVCVLTPVPAIATALLIDCTPLQPPSEGWQANYAFWIRWFAAVVAVSIGVTAQVREVILPEAISNVGAVAIALGSAAADVSLAMAIAATWRFPIPFGYILMVGPYLLIVLGFTLLVIGQRSLTGSPVLRQHIKSQATIIFAQGSVAMAYPLFTAVFYRLSGPEQAFLVVVMPVFKQTTKFIIANAARGLHEYVGPIVVFSVDVFNVYYVAICMQMSKTTVTTVLIIISDSFHVVIALRDIFRRSQRRRACSTTNYLEELVEMLHFVCEDPELLSHGCRIRVSAPSPLPLSDESRLFLESVSVRHLKDRAFSSVHPVGPQLPPAPERLLSAEWKLHQTSLASPTSTRMEDSHDETQLSRKGSAPRRLLTLMDADTGASAHKLRSTFSKCSKGSRDGCASDSFPLGISTLDRVYRVYASPAVRRIPCCSVPPPSGTILPPNRSFNPREAESRRGQHLDLWSSRARGICDPASTSPTKVWHLSAVPTCVRAGDPSTHRARPPFRMDRLHTAHATGALRYARILDVDLDWPR